MHLGLKRQLIEGFKIAPTVSYHVMGVESDGIYTHPIDWATYQALTTDIRVMTSTAGPNGFREEDVSRAQRLGLPLASYSLLDDTVVSFVPSTYVVNPIGRSFAWGEIDCLETVRLHYRQTRGVHITDYVRDETFEQTGGDIIARQVAAEGFSVVDPRAPVLTDDVLLFRSNGSAHAQHMGVLVGPNQLLHHPRGQLSHIDPLDGYWFRRLVGVLRYTGKAVS